MTDFNGASISIAHSFILILPTVATFVINFTFEFKSLFPNTHMYRIIDVDVVHDGFATGQYCQ